MIGDGVLAEANGTNGDVASDVALKRVECELIEGRKMRRVESLTLAVANVGLELGGLYSHEWRRGFDPQIYLAVRQRRRRDVIGAHQLIQYQATR